MANFKPVRAVQSRAMTVAIANTLYVPLAGGTMTGALTIASGTLTASAPALNISQTWNAVGTRFDGAVVNVTNTTSAAGSFIQTWQLAGVNKVAVNKTGGLEVYQLATDASNYERLTLTGVAGTSVNLTAETLGTGGDNLDIVCTPAGTGSFWAGGAKLTYTGNTPGTGLTFSSAAGFVCIKAYQLMDTNARALVGANPLGGGGKHGLVVADTSGLTWSNSSVVTSGTLDAGVFRSSAGIVEINDSTIGTYRDLKLRNLLVNPVAFASLVAAATAGNGARSYINNCSHSTFGTAADGAGAVSVPVWSNGTNWLVG